MKVRVYVIDFDVAPLVKRWALRIGTPFVALFVGGVAFAGLPGGYADGQPLTAEALTSNFNYLQGEIATLQGAAYAPSAFHAALGSPLSVPSNAATPVVFGNVGFDLGKEYDNSTGVFKPSNAGTYLLTCHLQWNAIGATGLWSVQIFNSVGIQIEQDTPISAIAGTVDAAGLIQLAAGEPVICKAFVNSSGQSVANANFSAARLY